MNWFFHASAPSQHFKFIIQKKRKGVSIFLETLNFLQSICLATAPLLLREARRRKPLPLGVKCKIAAVAEELPRARTMLVMSVMPQDVALITDLPHPHLPVGA